MKENFFKICMVMGCMVCGVEGSVRTVLSSQFLVRGEQAVFEIRVERQEPDFLPRMAEVEGVEIESLGYGRPQILPGRGIESSYLYSVSSYVIGVHEIPGMEVVVSGERFMTQPVRFEVFDPNELQWQEVVPKPDLNGEKIRYATIIKVPERKYFENQSMGTEIKVYVPTGLAGTVVDWGVPEYESKGLAVWRFEPAENQGRANLLGQAYASLAYPTTMTATETGQVGIGPATVRLTYQGTVFEGFTRRVELTAVLGVPAKLFEVEALPEGAPEGFDNAVGNFSISARISQEEVKEGEPLAIDVVVSGRGNLDNLRSPRMVDEGGWKVYDATASQRGNERRELMGSLLFSQFIRPLEMKTSVPPFRLVFFDPDTESYQTVTSAAIPLSMTPSVGGGRVESSGPPQALSVPIERMTDILGLIDTDRLAGVGGGGLPWWLGHAIAGLIASVLIGRIFWKRYGHRFERDVRERRRKGDFRELASASSGGGVEFLRAAGGFVEKWLDPEQDARLREILEERDRLCFQENKECAVVDGKRRREILQRLKKAAFCCILGGGFCGMAPQAEGRDIAVEAKAAYDSARYEEAARLWLEAAPYGQLSADALYNIGNAAYRMGAPGEAALYFRRALVRQESHGEARQNLRFIERKYGSIVVDRPAYQYTIAKVGLKTWEAGFWVGAWLVVIAGLIFPASAVGARWRLGGLVGLILGPILLVVGGLGWKFYPNDAQFAPLVRQAVVVAPGAVLHTDAARTSPEVIDAPQGTLAEVIKRSGRWAYIGFATKTRGWVPIEVIEMVVPVGQPVVPKVRKAEVDASNA